MIYASVLPSQEVWAYAEHMYAEESKKAFSR